MRLALLSAALLFACPVAAQEAAADAPPPSATAAARDDIIVIGKGSRKEQVRDFVKALSDAPPGVTDPIARFGWAPLCPAAVGLADAQDSAITARMRRVAEAAKVPLAKADCQTNALVIFADDKEEMIAALRKEHPAYFTSVSDEPVRIVKEAGPATAWHLEAYVDRAGTPVQFDSAAGYHVLNSHIGPSRISSAVRPTFLAAVVVIERRALDGLTTTQVADYAAMRAFTAAKPAKLAKSDAPTILTLLDSTMDSEIPITLTEWDMAYLRAFYATPPNHFGARQRAEIGKEVLRDLEKKEAATGEK